MDKNYIKRKLKHMRRIRIKKSMIWEGKTLIVRTCEHCYGPDKIIIEDPKMCCSGDMCGCDGLPVEKFYCPNCKESLFE